MLRSTSSIYAAKFATVDESDLEFARRALTLKGADLALELCLGFKVVENRSWAIPPGWCYIHAGGDIADCKRRMNLIRTQGLKAAGKSYLEGVLNTPEKINAYIQSVERVPVHSIVGMVKFEFHTTLEFIHSSTASLFAPHGYGTMFTGPLCNVASKCILFDNPDQLLCTGALGIWQLHESIYKKIESIRDEFNNPEDELLEQVQRFGYGNYHFVKTLFGEAMANKFPSKLSNKRKLEVSDAASE